MVQSNNNHFGNFGGHDSYQRGRSANANDRDRDSYNNNNQNMIKMSIMSKYNQQPQQPPKQPRNYSAPRDREVYDKSKIEQEIYRQ